MFIYTFLHKYLGTFRLAQWYILNNFLPLTVYVKGRGAIAVAYILYLMFTFFVLQIEQNEININI